MDFMEVKFKNLCDVFLSQKVDDKDPNGANVETKIVLDGILMSLKMKGRCESLCQV